MSQAATQNRVYQDDYRYLEDYGIPRGHAELDTFQEDYATDYMGDDGMGASSYESSTDPRAELAALQARIQNSPLTEEQRQRELAKLEELNQLVGSLGEEGASLFEEKIAEIEEEISEGVLNHDQVKASEKILQGAIKDIKSSRYLSEEQRKGLLKQIEEARQALAEDPSLNIKEELGEVLGRLEELQAREEATQQEVERAKGIGSSIIAALDEIFQAPPRKTSGKGLPFPAEFAFDQVRHVLDGVNTILSPVRGVLSETAAPRSSLKLPQEGRDLDLILGKNSGMAQTTAPGDIVEALYSDLSPEQQKDKIREALKDSPPAVKSYILSLVVSTIQRNDSKKLEFIEGFNPEIFQFISKEIKTGQEDIKSGAMAKTGFKGYNVGFDGMNYKIINTNTAWYRRDWDDWSIPTAQLCQPMTDALRALEEYQQPNESSPIEPSVVGENY